ncbi:class I SAM-dependent methyltransferase [Agrococcus terreus]|uniref:16S RNA G1207 methylase RsmC n=1 Tax=Agrococcus terreus TaxID=574649 RepID=A0ABQ2KKN3_9MICO|nr:methyltransferase [Agrococcus terreus]GGN86214.1 16S RNA G1207 methylase RsmC [Agrococcus terreus]
MPDHYFSPDPAAPETLRTIRVPLAGRERELVTATGVFSGDRLDVGTSVLLDAVPAPPEAGDLLDLGCGWGPIAATLALRSPAARVWAVDVNARALSLVERNAELLSLSNIEPATPDRVPDDLRFATIWSNPPIRIGKAQLHELLETWIPRLAPDATAWLVVQKHLGADSLQRWLDERFPDHDVERATSKKTYRILAVTAPSED